MRSSVIITALMAALALSVGGCDNQAGGGKAKTDSSAAKQGGGKKGDAKQADKSKIKVSEEYLPEAQEKVTTDNLDETVSRLEDEILSESKK